MALHARPAATLPFPLTKKNGGPASEGRGQAAIPFQVGFRSKGVRQNPVKSVTCGGEAKIGICR